MNWKLKLLVVLAGIILGGGVAYRQIDKFCAPANPTAGDHEHDEAKETANQEGLASRICGVVGVIADRGRLGTTGPLANPKVDEHQDGAKANEHGHKEGEGKEEKRGDQANEHGHKEGKAEEEKQVRLSPDQIREFKIETDVAAEGPVAIHIERPAEVKFNQNRFVHVVPRAPGIVSRVEVSQGESVKEGQLLAILESRELADAKGNYLAAAARRQLASETFVREDRLWKQKVSAENDYLKAKAELAETDINLATAEQKLRTLGLSADSVKGLSTDDPKLTEYRIVSPQSGTVTERHLTLGESVETEREIFTVADVSTVWIDVSIYPGDIATVKPGQRVSIDLGDGDPVVGKIEFVTPEVKEATRTAVARVIVDNASGRLRPGMFVTAQIELSRESAPVRIPKTAVQREENGNVVYVEHDGAFAPRPIKLGRENHEFVEVVDGLQPGETYVSTGGFVIKAQLGKASFGEGHAH